MIKQFIFVACALSTACSTGFGGFGAQTAARPSCAGGVVRSQSELARYRGCSTIDGDLLVENVDSLAPLGALERVNGALHVEHTRRLYSLAGLEHLASVRELSLHDNSGLISGGALRELAHAERVDVAQNPRLSRAYGFEQGLAKSHASLWLEKNTGLEAEGMKQFRPLASGTTVAER